MAFLNENEWILLNETAYNISFIYTVEEMQKGDLDALAPLPDFLRRCDFFPSAVGQRGKL